MSEEDLKFCEEFEAKLEKYKIMDLLRRNLTSCGAYFYVELKEYLTENLDRYMELTNVR